MEFNRIKITGNDIVTIFNGSHYYFYSHFYGLVAIAERTTENYEKSEESFDVYVGNENCLGGSLCDGNVVAGVKKFINKCETKYVSTKKVTYFVIKKDLRKYYLNVESREY